MHVITGLEVGGAEMMLHKLISTMNPDRWHPMVLTLRPGGELTPSFVAKGVSVASLNLTNPIAVTTAGFKLARQVRSFRPDIVQGWMYHGNLAAFGARLFAPRASVLWNVRQSLYDPRTLKRTTMLLVRTGARLSRHVRHVIYNSRTSAVHHQGFGYAADKTRIIPNGFDTERFAPNDETRNAVRKKYGIPLDADVIGLVANFHPIKDHPSFLRAAAVIGANHPAARFVLAGRDVEDGNSRLSELLERHPCADRIHMLGAVDDVPSLMCSLDILCSSSKNEGFSNVIGEAMACGVPCVVTDVGESRTIVGDVGLVVPAEDHDQLAAACGTLLDRGPAQRRELGRKARNRIIAEYSMASVATAYEQLYDAAVDKTAPVG